MDKSQQILVGAVMLAAISVLAAGCGSNDNLRADRHPSYIATTTDAVRFCLTLYKVEYDEIWVPSQNDVRGLLSSLREYLQGTAAVATQTYVDRDYLLTNFDGYRAVYAGFVRGESKYVVCRMVRGSGEGDLDDLVSVPLEGPTCDYVLVVFEAKSRSVVSVNCHRIAAVPTQPREQVTGIERS